MQHETRQAHHEVKLIVPQYVRPFVKRQKNDTSDAEAIVIAAQRPEMRFVAPKSEDQQSPLPANYRRPSLLTQHRSKAVFRPHSGS